MDSKDILHEDLVDERVAAGVVTAAFFLGSVIAGAKIRVALFSLLAPIVLIFALPHMWRAVVRTVKRTRPAITAE